MYKIIRLYFKGGQHTIETGLTLKEAQAYCCNPETSSRTCTKAANTRRTRERGPWFDCYKKA